MANNEPSDQRIHNSVNAESAELERATKLFEEFGQHKYDKVVAFVDMLGFSTLTEEFRVEPELFEEMQRPVNIEFLTASLEGASPLAERFIRFHMIVDEAVRSTRLTEDGSSITFSDCAFYAADKLHSVVDYAVEVMHRSLEQRIPVRIGIGCGEFLVVRIRSDFGMTNQDHVVQFLGLGYRGRTPRRSAASKAYVLLHPSVALLYTEKWYSDHGVSTPREYYNRMPLPANEIHNRANIDHEINYLWHPPHDDDYWAAIQELSAAAPASVQDHYAATIASMNRMRQALGRAKFLSGCDSEAR